MTLSVRVVLCVVCSVVVGSSRGTGTEEGQQETLFQISDFRFLVPLALTLFRCSGVGRRRLLKMSCERWGLCVGQPDQIRVRRRHTASSLLQGSRVGCIARAASMLAGKEIMGPMLRLLRRATAEAGMRDDHILGG